MLVVPYRYHHLMLLRFLEKFQFHLSLKNTIKMLDEGESLKIASIFILFAASLFGILLPLYFQNEILKSMVPAMNALAAGVMLGLAFVSDRFYLFDII